MLATRGSESLHSFADPEFGEAPFEPTELEPVAPEPIGAVCEDGVAELFKGKLGARAASGSSTAPLVTGGWVGVAAGANPLEGSTGCEASVAGLAGRYVTGP